jgi:hypothetical protein
VYIEPFNTATRGIAQQGKPLTGEGQVTTTAPGSGNAFNFPAAPSTPPAQGNGPGFRRTVQGSFIGTGPYLYSYSYATWRNDAGSFGQGQGFFSTAATPATLTFQNKAGGTFVATARIKRGTNRFGGVMRLLGQFETKVCYFYGGGCGLGYGTWVYEAIGDAAYKSGGVVTSSYTTNFSFTYYNTALASIAKYDIVAQRFPWTTGTVTVAATGRGPHKTWEQRKGFDNRTATSGMGTVQLVSPILTQWLAQSANAPKFETGGIAVMQIKFVPEPGALSGLVAGLSLLMVLRRFRS